MIDAKVRAKLAEAYGPAVCGEGLASLTEAPAVRLIGVHAGTEYLVLEWFSRTWEVSTWRRLFWVSQS